MHAQVTMERSFSLGPLCHRIAAVVVSIAVFSGCSTVPSRVETDAGVGLPAVEAEAAGPDEAPVPTGIGAVLKQRAESAAQGVVIGAMLGAPAGGIIGSGAGAAVLGIYGLITGDVPLGSDEPGPRQRGDEPPDDVLAGEIDAALTPEQNEPKESGNSEVRTSPVPSGD